MVGAVTVSATSSKSFLVKFAAAPADTSKVTFAVKGSTGTAVTTTTTWNEAKTEATVTASYNLTTDTYSVNVKNDTTDLGTSNIAISQQKVAKITITSTVLSIAPISYVPNSNPLTPTATSGEGFATYKVIDQYGIDVTNTPLGNNIQWNCGIGAIDTAITKNGVIGIKSQGGIPLTQYTTASINGYDTDSYVTANASLTVSQTKGLISDMKLNKLTSVNNADFNAGNTTGQWYVDFTALDASGNPTTNYTMIKAGIIAVNGGAFLDVTVDKDPIDNAKAVLSVKINPAYTATLTSDQQIPITVLTAGGSNASLTVTLKKATAVNTFSLSAPAQMVASGETVILPFTAADQNGNPITSYSQLAPKVGLSISAGTIALVRNADGTASVQATMPKTSSLAGSLSVYIQASIPSAGKNTPLTLSVQQPAKPDSLSIDNAVGVPFMQVNAKQSLDTGYYYGGISVNDQYGRQISLSQQQTTGKGVSYYVVQPTTTSSILLATGSTVNGRTNGSTINLEAKSEGTATVEYKVFKVTNDATTGAAGTPVDTGISKMVQYTVVKNSDIVDYTLDAVTDPIKMIASTSTASAIDAWVNSTKTADVANSNYAADPVIYGKTAGGTLAKLDAKQITNVVIDSGDFVLVNQANATGGNILRSTDDLNADKVNGATIATDFAVFAKKLSSTSTATSASTNLSVTIKDASGNSRIKSTVIKSTTDGSIPKTITISASNVSGDKGLSKVGNTVYVDLANAKADMFDTINGKVITAYDANGATNNRAPIYFAAKDQFGQNAQLLVQ